MKDSLKDSNDKVNTTFSKQFLYFYKNLWSLLTKLREAYPLKLQLRLNSVGIKGLITVPYVEFRIQPYSVGKVSLITIRLRSRYKLSISRHKGSFERMMT